MKMSENKVACHIGQVSCKLFHLSRAIGQAGRCTTARAILMLKVSITETTKVRAFFFTIHPVFIGINIYLIAELDYKSLGKHHFLSLF